MESSRNVRTSSSNPLFHSNRAYAWIFLNVPNTKLHGTPSRGSCNETCGQAQGQMERQADRTKVKKIIVTFRDCRSTPKNLSRPLSKYIQRRHRRVHSCFWGSQEISTLRKNQSHYRLHKTTLLVTALSATNGVHTLSPYCRKLVLILFFRLSLCFPSEPFASVSGGETLYKYFFTATRATWPGRLILIGLMTRIICREKYKSWSTWQFSLSSLPSPSHIPIFSFSTLFSCNLPSFNTQQSDF